MSDLKSTSVYRGLPSPDSPDFNKAVKEIIEQLVGQRGNVLDRAATLRDLASPALVGYLNDQSVSVTVSGTSPFNDSTVPPPPLDLELITDSDGDRLNAFNNMLVWTAQDSDIISHFEVWIAESASRSSAILTGIVTYPESTYTHANTDPTKTYWYWVRSISRSGIASTWEPNDPINGYVVVSDRITKETLDRVMNSLKGESPAAYSAGKTYDPGERCSYSCADGKTRVYTAVVETTGNAPASGIPPVTNSTYWERTGILLSGEVGGENVVGIDGNMVVDGTIITRNLDAGVVTTDKIAVGAVNWETQITNIPSALFQTFYSSSAPETGMSTGDYWVDSDDNSVYRYDGDSWESIQDSGIAEALQAAGDAQATADGKIITFAQATPPTAEAVGDLWIDTDDKNKLYRWSGSEWISVRDTDIDQALSDAATGIADAATAQGTADGKVVTFLQPTEPTAEGVGDLWIDTDDGNKLYRWPSDTYDDETGCAWERPYHIMSFASGQSFIKPTACDLTAYTKGADAKSLGADVVTNGDQEAALTSGSDAQGTTAQSTEQVHGGTYSAKFTIAGAPYYYGYRVFNFSELVTPGKTYLVTLWVFLPSAQTANYIFINFYPSGAGWGCYHNEYTTDQWVKVQREIKVIDQLTLYIGGGNNVGTPNADSFYFDDISIEEVRDDCQYGITLRDSANKEAKGYIETPDSYIFGHLTAGTNLLTNPGFETAGGGGEDVFGTWVENTTPGGTIEDETVVVYSGSHAAKLSCGASNNQHSVLQQIVSTAPGKTYLFAFLTRGDGTNAGCYSVYDSGGTYPIPMVTTGVTSTDWTWAYFYFTALSSVSYVYVCSPTQANGYAYFDDVQVKELSHCGESGVTIVPTPSSTTPGWTSIDSGFNYNDTSYTFDVYPVWVAIPDAGIAQAIEAAGDAQATADGKIVTFAQAAIPTSEGIGDLWIDTDDNNKLYRAESVGADQITAGEWVAVRDAGIAQALSDASDAQATADGKVTTFFQDNTPTAEGTGDLWIDTNDSNKLYRWSGEAWVAVRDTGIAAALADAATAQATADGKIISTYQPTAPVAEAVGDLWFDTDDSNQPYRCEDTTMDDETGVTFGPEYHGMSFADGAAFIRTQGLDLGKYVGRQITVTDYNGKKAIGWISQPAGCGPELVTNGTFDSDVDDWAGYTDYDYETCEWQNGKMHCVNTSGSGYRHSNVSFQLTAGKRYLVSFDIDLTSGALPLWCLANSAAGALMILNYMTCAEGHNTFEVDATATSGAGKFFFYNTSAADFTIDNVSVREMTNSNLLLNSSFETAGGGGADIWSEWNEYVAGDCAIADETTNPGFGSHCAKLSMGTSNYSEIANATTMTVVPGCKYRLTFWTRGDGTGSLRYLLYDMVNFQNYSTYYVSPGITSTGWTQVTADFVARSTGLRVYFTCPEANNTSAWVDHASIVALETLGSELITNGTMEADSNWANMGVPTTNERSTTQVKHGTYSRKLVSSAGDQGIVGDSFTTTAGKVYKVSCWVYPATLTSMYLYIRAGDDATHDGSAWIGGSAFYTVTGLTPGAWNQVVRYYTECGSGSSAHTRLAATGADTYYFDDVSIKEVTDVATDGVHIVSEYGGSTRNWQSKETGFIQNSYSSTLDVFPLWLPVDNPVADWSKIYGDGKPSDNATSDLSLVVTTGCTLIGGNGATKSSGVSSWDTSVYSRDGYTGGAFCSAMASATNHYIMFGLDANPTEDNNYTSIDYAWYYNAAAECAIYESGSSIGTYGSYTVNTVLSMAYDGSNIRYMKDGVVVRTVAVSPNLVFFFDSSFHDVGATITNIRFSPLSSRNTVTESVSGSAPSNPVSGDLWYQTDTKLLKKYTGAVWDTVGNSFDTCDDLGDGAVYGKMPKNWKHASDATYIDGGKVYTGTIVASAISTTSLSALSANLGTVTAGLAKSSDGKIQVDFDNKWIKVWDASSTLRVHLGYIP